jgi:hypothetical protein
LQSLKLRLTQLHHSTPMELMEMLSEPVVLNLQVLDLETTEHWCSSVDFTNFPQDLNFGFERLSLSGTVSLLLTFDLASFLISRTPKLFNFGSESYATPIHFQKMVDLCQICWNTSVLQQCRR